jgi:hypothetical protein
VFSIAFNRPLATFAVVSGLLVAAAPAGAKVESPKDQLSGLHARYVGPGSDGMQRATGDGTSNTVIFAAVEDADRGQVPTSQVSSAFSGDAYTNEMGITGAGDGAPMQRRTKVNTPYALPEIGDEVLTYEPQTPRADGIIAILIGAIGTNDDRRGQNEEKLAAPAPLTAHLGSTRGSFIDGSVVYGSDVRIPTASSILPYIEQDN